MTPIPLDEAVRRYGDDLYRAAVLLSPTPQQAAVTLLTMLRRLAQDHPAGVEEGDLLTALAAALPHERRSLLPQRSPAWTHPSSERAEDAPLLAAIAGLPRVERQALVPLILRTADPAAAARSLFGSEIRFRPQERDAMLALAPHSGLDLAPEDLEPHFPGAECRAVQAAIALNDPALHTDTSLRGHLALCSSCRNVARSWAALRERVAEALRGGLRELYLPPALAADIQELLTPGQHARRHHWGGIWLQRGLLIGAVLICLLLLLIPRPQAAPVTDALPAPSGENPKRLLERAVDQVYAPPEGGGVWRSRYMMIWTFADGSYAPLIGSLWIDTTSSRHRIQLIHEQGGGPFEFELADGSGSLWYAVTGYYGAAIYPVPRVTRTDAARVRLLATDQVIEQHLEARLATGAWGLPQRYLRQALAAESIQSWGGSTLDDGTRLEVLGFRGRSPLSMPLSESGPANDATILLTIETQTGRLREVRELLGQPGTQQVARTTWSYLEGDWLPSGRAVIDLSLASAWNGAGGFENQSASSTQIPVIPQWALLALPEARDNISIASRLVVPSEVPGDTNRALLVEAGSLPSLGSPGPCALYFGADHVVGVCSLIPQPSETNRFSVSVPNTGEYLRLDDDRMAWLITEPTQRHRAYVLRNDRPIATLITIGLDREGMVRLLSSLGPLTNEVYQAQERLFIAGLQGATSGAWEFEPHPPGVAQLSGELANP
jgi:hypothetical protein